MNEKRKHPRFRCKIRVKFEFYEDDPSKLEIEKSMLHKSKGYIMDISKGGAFLVTKTRVFINMPIKLSFKVKNKLYSPEGTIVRTGLIKNNPSEIAQKLATSKPKGDTYIAIKFSTIINEIEK